MKRICLNTTFEMFGENNKFTFGASLGQTTQQSLLTKPTVTGAFTFGQPQTQPVFGCKFCMNCTEWWNYHCA